MNIKNYKTCFRKILSSALILLALSLLVYPSTVLANNITLSAFNTVVGFETQIKAKGLRSFEQVMFKVEKPDSSILRIGSQADGNGNAVAILLESETKKSGLYKVSLEGQQSRQQFEVFAGEMDERASRLISDKTVLNADSEDKAQIQIKISDEFGNALPLHEVKLISNRRVDTISPQIQKTDENGVANFSVSSSESGTSKISAVDETAATAIAHSLTINFSNQGPVYREVSRDPVSLILSDAIGNNSILLAQSGQPVARFIIDNLPSTVTVNETPSFRVKAVDSMGNIVPSYLGTIVFNSTDLNAIKPSNYTFQAGDQGQKTFDLGLSFRTAGAQTLIVTQQGNDLIRGERTVQVMPASTPSTGGDVRITRPGEGSYTVTTMDIAGQAPPSSRVRVYDNGTLIQEVTAGTDGRFIVSSSLLRDGQHVFRAESGSASDTVTITIDSTPARAENIEINPSEVAPSGTFQVTVRSDPDLTRITASVAEFIVDLTPDMQNPGLYRGTLTAPAQDGLYTVNVNMWDSHNLPSPTAEASTRLRVNSDMVINSSSFSVPSKVLNVRATPGNAKVTLNWNAANAESGIALYRIYYGVNQNNLNMVLNSTGTSTMLDVPNLTNGTQYYFEIVGVDNNGSEGDNRSDTVSATPSSTILAGSNGNLANGSSSGANGQFGQYANGQYANGAFGANVYGNGQVPVLCDTGPCPVAPFPNSQPQDGPEVLVMMAASFIGSAIYRQIKRNRAR